MAGRHNVLIVDDDAQVVGCFVESLDQSGYAATGTTSGREALALVNAAMFDLIVLDLHMPKPDGFDVFKAVRTRDPSVKVIVVSGFLQGPLLKAAELLGAAATLEKPVSPELLNRTVQKVLNTRETRD